MSRTVSPLHLLVEDPSHTSDARRQVVGLARSMGFSEGDQGRVALAVTEICTNLLKHAGRGQMIVRRLEPAAGIEILALDAGGGMGDLPLSMTDGYSTAGSAGEGLGAIERVSTLFEVWTRSGLGTALVCRVQPGPAPASRLETGSVCLARAGESQCGDAIAVRAAGGRVHVLVVDGLGHGPDAAAAAAAAVKVFHEDTWETPLHGMELMHGALHGTRGAAAGLATVDIDGGVVTFCGAGNVEAVVLHGDESRHLISQNGTVGRQVRTLREYTESWAQSDLLVMHSDGLRSRWRLDAYPGLRQRHPALIAGMLFRDFTRGYDDLSVMVARAVHPG